VAPAGRTRGGDGGRFRRLSCQSVCSGRLLLLKIIDSPVVRFHFYWFSQPGRIGTSELKLARVQEKEAAAAVGGSLVVPPALAREPR
jgi:hypothetical protein